MRLTQISIDEQKPFGELAVWSESKQGWILVRDLLGYSEEEELVLSVSDVFEGTAFLQAGGDEVALSDADDSNVLSIDIVRALIDAFEEEGDEEFNVYKPGIDSSRYAQLFCAPEKILCVGLNYADHAKEFGDPLPTEPVIFNKAPSALNHCDGKILIPAVSNRVDYEGELVVIIGKEGRNIPQEEAMEYVAGYCCGNDVSARDWQKDKPAGQWFLGKSFDSFAVVGPYLITADELGDPNNLKIETRLNGQIMQSSNTSHFIFKIDRLISYLSQVMTLKVGDLIFTGTPNGVGDARKPPIYMKSGDEIVVEIEKVGVLTNIVE